MDEFILSKYNCFKTIDSIVVCVNLLNKILFSLEKEKYELLEIYADNLSELNRVEPVFFSAMKKLGIITEKEKGINMPTNILLRNRSIVFYNNRYRLTINPTLNCNFSCWYCYELHTKKRMGKTIIAATLKYIENLIKVNKISHLNLDWFGGEPLLCYETVIKSIALPAKKMCDENGVAFESGITTNGYLITDDMISFFKDINMQAFQITLDGEKSTHDNIRFGCQKEPSYDKIVSNIILLAEKLHPNSLALRINFTQASFRQIINIIDSFPIEVRNRITILLQQVWQDKDNAQMTAREIENMRYIFENAGFKVDKDILNFKGYACYADLYNQAVINYDGRVFKCTARNFEREKEDGILTQDGLIDWEDSLALKITKSTFENSKCMSCKYLPVCFGPCSQKVSLVKTADEFEKFCFQLGVEDTLDYIMQEFSKSDKVLTPLLDYR